MQQLWVAPLAQGALAAGTAYNTSVALADVSPAPQVTLPANFLQAGSILRFTAWGTFSNTLTPTLLMGVYYGGVAGVALAASGAVTTTTGATNWPWRIELTTIIRSVGSAGTAMSQGAFDLGTSLTALSHIPIPATALATVAVDTTTAKTLTIGAQWGTSSASNTLTVHGMIAESVS